MDACAMDTILLSENSNTRDGLEAMLTAAIGEHGYHLSWVDAEIALLVTEVAKRAPDRPEWFPRGKWATIQSLQVRVNGELDKLFDKSTGGNA